MKLAGRASRAAPLNKTLLKSRAVTGKIFKSNTQSAKSAVAKSKISKLSPHPQSDGLHTSFKYCSRTGRINGYETYDYNPVQGNWSAKIRFRGTGKYHGGVKPPIILERYPSKGPGSTPIVPRKPNSWELPYGYE